MIARRKVLAYGGAAALSVAPVLTVTKPAVGADYPSGPVKIIVAQAAGASLDVLLRVVTDHLSRAWGSQVVVLNVPTGAGVVASRALASATPDGHTLFMAGASVYTVLPETQPTLAADIANFIPISFTGEQPMAIVVSPSVQATTLRELIDLSKRTPDGLNCAVSGRNALAHLTGELFGRRSGANLNFIYYPGASQALNDVIAGRVPVLVNNLPGILGAMSNNQVRPLAVTFPSRLPDFPNIPSAAETVPDFNVSGWTMLVAPGGTSPAMIQKVHEDVLAIQGRPEFKKQLEALGVYPRPMSPQQINEFIAGEQKIWRPLVRELVKTSR